MAWGATLGSTGVALAALAAHALPGRLAPADLAAVESALRIQLVHAPALLAAGLHLRATKGRARQLGLAAAAGLAAGSLLFCGAIYLHHLASLPTGALAPIGGTLLITGWALLAASILATP